MRIYILVVLSIICVGLANINICNADRFVGEIDWEHLENSKVYPKYDIHIEDGKQKYINLDLVYPLMYIPDKIIQEKINKDVSKYVYGLKDKYDKGFFYSGKMDYEKIYEDSFCISIVLKEQIWNIGAAHPQYSFIGLVYDKLSGERVSVQEYIPSVQCHQLELLLNNGIAKLVNERGVNVNLRNRNLIKRVSNDFIVIDINTIALIYQPYELAPFSDGVTYLILNDKAMDYINRTNSNKIYGGIG